jgi:cbb3-type cytochrome oxidase maturation protein
MDILYLLIPFSALLVLAILGLFAWALRGGQFDDLEREGERIVEVQIDIAQAGASGAPQQSPRLQRGGERWP